MTRAMGMIASMTSAASIMIVPLDTMVNEIEIEIVNKIEIVNEIEIENGSILKGLK